MPSYEEMRKIFDKVEQNFQDRDKKLEEERRKEIEKMGLTYLDRRTPKKQHFDHPNTMENSTATFLWVASLVIGALFKGGWMIWVCATFIWLMFITRHED